MATTTLDGSTHAPGKPRIWVCGWDWCPQTFRQGNDLAKHLQDVHFNNIVAVKKSDWNDYLRSVEGQSGGTGSWMVDIPSGSIQTHSQGPSICQLSPPGPSGAQQHSPSLPPSTPLKPQIPRNLSRPRASFQQSPATSQPANPSPLRTSASPVTTSPHVHVHKPSTTSSNSGTPRASSSDSDAPAAKRRRTTSFAGYTAQSSPMSTPSVSSMPPSPALSNMITDAINAAGRINAGTLTPSPRAAHTQTARRGRRPSGGGSSGSSLPRRTSMGVSPPIAHAHAHAPRSLVEVLSRAATSPTPALGAAHLTSSSSSFRAHASIRSSTSAQAVEDALTQDLGPSAASSPARSQPQSGVSSLKYLSSQSTSSQSHAERARQSSSQSAEHSSFHGSHAVESQLPVARSPESYSYTQGHTAASQSGQSAAPLPARPPIPRTRRAQSHAQSQYQSQSQAPPQAQNKPASSGASLPVPIPRNLRPRSRTPAVAQAPAPAPAATPPGPYADLVEALVRAHDPSQHSPPIPRRTTRSQAGSAASSAQATSAGAAAGGTSEAGGAGQKGKRARSKPPSTGPVRRSSRARSRTPSYEAGAGGGKAQAKSRGLPAVDEQPDDEDAAPAQGVPAPQAQPQPPSQSPNKFRSGTTYVPIPRRTQRPPPPAQAQSLSQLRSRSPSRPKGPIAPVKPDPDAEEGGTGAAMDVDAPVLSSQVDSERQTQKRDALGGQSQSQSQNQSQDAEDSQGSEGRGYVEGYGFDMGSLVLQTQAPYKWSQSP